MCMCCGLHTHSSLSNVVLSLIIHDNIYIRDVAENMKPLWKAKRLL